MWCNMIFSDRKQRSVPGDDREKADPGVCSPPISVFYGIDPGNGKNSKNGVAGEDRER